MERIAHLSDFINTIKAILPQLQADFNINTLEVFGSYVRGEQTADSDLDILITFNQTPSLLEFINLENKLSDILDVQVDLVMKESLKQPLDKVILQEAIGV